MNDYHLLRRHLLAVLDAAELTEYSRGRTQPLGVIRVELEQRQVGVVEEGELKLLLDRQPRGLDLLGRPLRRQESPGQLRLALAPEPSRGIGDPVRKIFLRWSGLLESVNRGPLDRHRLPGLSGPEVQLAAPARDRRIIGPLNVPALEEIRGFEEAVVALHEFDRFVPERLPLPRSRGFSRGLERSAAR
jgi:hypothetical protein